MVYALIPVKDRLEQTLKCLEAFKKQTYKDIQVVVIDDGSIDGTDKRLAKDFPNVKVLKGDGNLWCMGAYAFAIDYVRNIWQEGDYILTQNQDVQFDSDFVDTLVKQSVQMNRSIVGSTNYSSDRKTIIYNNVIVKNGVFSPIIQESNNQELLPALTLATRGTLFPIEVFKKIGNFSKLFPHYAGDYEICARARKKGFKLYSSTVAKVYSNDNNHNLAWRIRHKEKKTLKDIIDLYTSRRSPNNLYYSILLTILHIPFPLNIFGTLRILVACTKFILYDFIYLSLIKR